MNLGDFKTIVENFKMEDPFMYGEDSFDAKPTDEFYYNVEKELNVILPIEYKEFLFNYGGGIFANSRIFSFDENSNYYLIRKNNEWKHLRNDFLIFSENGCGDFYGFKIIENYCSSKIWFYDHEINSWKETKYNDLFEFLVEDSF